MFQLQDRRRYWHHAQLDMRLMIGAHVNYAYPRHTHDHYALCVVDHGLQSFTHKGTKYYTPPNGLILINPDIVHTGEPAKAQGFRIRALYPTLEQLQAVASELQGCPSTAPFFQNVRIDDTQATRHFLQLHRALTTDSDPLVVETLYFNTMAYLIEHYAELKLSPQTLGDERRAVQQAIDYIQSNYGARLDLAALASEVGFSRYYFLRVFHQTVGMPPHAYVQNVRVQRAQDLIRQGESLASVAHAVGFSNQSHLTRSFKRFVGITPGAFASQMGARS